MIKKIAFLVVFYLHSSILLSQEKKQRIAAKASPATEADDGDLEGDKKPKKQRRTASGKKIVDVDNQTVVQDSSAYWREHQSWSAIAELFGFGIGAGSGVSLGKYLNQDLIAELSVVNQKYELSLWGATYTFKATAIEPRVKIFFANSFYTNLGLTHTSESGVSTFSGSRNEQKSSTLGATVAIGNRWQWEHFSIGCDWFGYTKPLSILSYDASDPGKTTAELENDKTNAKEQAGREKYRLLQFYLGVSF